MQAEGIRSPAAFYMPQGKCRGSLIDILNIASMAMACLTGSRPEGNKYAFTVAKDFSTHTTVRDSQELFLNLVSFRMKHP